VDAVANSIVSELKFELQKFRRASTVELAFGYLRRLAEENGVFVLLAGNLGSHHTTIDVSLFRGFALADEIAPFILINDQDSKAAWSFTLLHELAHLWLEQSGISGGWAETRKERFCSDVASKILLPDIIEIGRLDGPIAAKIETISKFAENRRISASMVAYRLFLPQSMA
jgi:Zn-dependent peptidase ImmA (M78 family)